MVALIRSKAWNRFWLIMLGVGVYVLVLRNMQELFAADRPWEDDNNGGPV